MNGKAPLAAALLAVVAAALLSIFTYALFGVGERLDTLSDRGADYYIRASREIGVLNQRITSLERRVYGDPPPTPPKFTDKSGI